MIQQTKLYCYFDNDGVFSDLTMAVNDWLRDSSTFDFTAGHDHLYLGRYKPFNALWFELSTANAVAQTTTLEYYNGTDWTALTPDLEDTKGLTRSGWIRWTTPTDWTANSVNSLSKFWARLSFSATFVPAASIGAIGIVFCDDQVLKTEPFNYAQSLPSGVTSHILVHVAVRDEIMTRIKSEGYLKLDGISSNPRPYNEWDLMDVDDVKQAAKNLALSKIFFHMSKTQDDSFMEKSKRFLADFESAIKSICLSLDLDDDGFESPNESAVKVTQAFLTRF